MRKFVKAIAIASALVATSTAFGAENMVDLFDDWAETFKGAQSIIVLGAALVGIGFLGAGAIQLKKHGENPQQAPLNKGLIFLASGAALLGLTTMSGVLQGTVTGDTSSDREIEDKYK